MVQALILEDSGDGSPPGMEGGGSVACYSRPTFENEVHLALRVDNYFQIAAAYGQRAADRAVAEVHNTLLTLGGRKDAATRTAVLPDGNERLKVIIRSRTDEVRSHIHACCIALGTTPIPCDGASVVPVISVGFPAPDLAVDGSERDAALLRSASQALEAIAPGGGVPTISPAYESDMAAAVALLSALRDALSLAWQPVRNAESVCEILYREALLRIVDADGSAASAGAAMQAVERLGCERALDSLIVSKVLDELEAAPDIRLAVNISAGSARLGFWWTELLSRLARDRSLARRLIIEITETAPLPAISEAVAFVDRLRALGCAVAIDDFGVGFSSIRTLLALRPDIIKIDALFLHRATRSDTDRRAFEHLVGLANSLAATVVVEGVQTGEQEKLACDAGAFWQQGYHHGRPSLCRPWRVHAHRSMPEQPQASLPNAERRQAMQ